MSLVDSSSLFGGFSLSLCEVLVCSVAGLVRFACPWGGGWVRRGWSPANAVSRARPPKKASEKKFPESAEVRNY